MIYLHLNFVTCNNLTSIVAVNMVNGMSVNGLGEVSMDTTQAVINNNLIANNLIALGKQLTFGFLCKLLSKFSS